MSTLLERVVSSGKWVGGFRAVQRLLGIVKSIVLARLLTPEAFGLYGIAAIVLAVFRHLSETGLNKAVIQAEELDDKYLHTAFWMGVVRGMVIAVGVYLAAPYAAAFFNEPKAEPLLKALALAPVFLSFKSIGTALLQRNYEFRTFAIYKFTHTTAEIGSAIILAVILRNAWALIIGLIIGRFVVMISSYWFHPYRPKIQFDWNRGRQIFDYGIWMMFAGITRYGSLKLDDIALGRWTDASVLGLYQLAFVVANMLAQQLSGILKKVLFPAFSEVQNQNERLRNVYRQSFGFTAALIIPSAAGLAVVSSQFVPVVFGEKWTGMTTMLAILSVSAAFRSLSQIQDTLLISLGRTDRSFQANVIRLIALVIVIYPCFAAWGADGIAVAAAISTFSTLFFYDYLTRTVLDEGPDTIRLVIPPLIATGVMVGSLLPLKATLHFAPVLELPILVCCGVVVYLAVLYPLDQVVGNDSFGLFEKLIRTLISEGADSESDERG